MELKWNQSLCPPKPFLGATIKRSKDLSTKSPSAEGVLLVTSTNF